jgi:hypothetical protein
VSTTNQGSGFGLVGPFSGGQGLHRQGMDLGTHSIAQGLVDALMAANAALAVEFCRNNGGKEVLAITFDGQVLTRQTGGDELLNLFRRGVGHGVSLDVK